MRRCCSLAISPGTQIKAVTVFQLCQSHAQQQADTMLKKSISALRTTASRSDCAADDNSMTEGWFQAAMLG